MRIDSQLQNLFDQYTVEENRVTNALLQVLVSSPVLVRRFLERFCPSISLKGITTVSIWTQRKPGEGADAGGDARDTVPDGWFILQDAEDNVLRVVALEVKIVEGTADRKQLEG
ncbi:MAG: hypothetical protein ABIK09_02130, partial [Pseudomonadota bacterium]